MNVERVRHSGQLVVTELVTDGSDVWFYSESFYGYSQRDAKSEYRASMAEQGLVAWVSQG